MIGEKYENQISDWGLLFDIGVRIKAVLGINSIFQHILTRSKIYISTRSLSARIKTLGYIGLKQCHV